MSTTTDPVTNKEPSISKDSEEILTKKTLEEDDEFEDFPVDNWPSSATLRESTQLQANLWEENWDDVEVDDDFANELKNELDRYKQEHQ
ncbi:hypothetical protein KAFR_0E03880 [Kazachstania africana CBS 2517]|uniref:26S proteasome complex subunit SEM1 n=1 Tax=Kazachstania africana (strain ATCC 22294 / BCRC 22015 / CBS 2517 / CECT 1963 / NBRC 1671 / NRRL Y-8276) TaxID=1071382 RepID=H2AVY9_KAZAF|nr:hypothetical protein KAFR_0E03880 [Kazachstania africana CBS 2517]CCF58539.1 hypothetical protein KAFR_0E03880 [Kazachstania africana CBS 2517]